MNARKRSPKSNNQKIALIKYIFLYYIVPDLKLSLISGTMTVLLLIVALTPSDLPKERYDNLLLIPGLEGPSTLSETATPPPMGWSSWNAHFSNINQSVIEATANAMVTSGMKAAGYQYIDIDGGWWNGQRDANGNISVNAQQWPDGMAALVNYIHQRGLKAGIYTDAGKNGCGGANQGSEGHYNQDMQQFARWGFDLVKVDWCGGYQENLNPAVQYSEMRNAILQTGHPMLLNLCDWGFEGPQIWGPAIGTTWRTTGDISTEVGTAAWEDGIEPAILKNFDENASNAIYQSPGAYNDPDMLEVGAAGISLTESQTHFALWAIEGAPLITGTDITTMSQDIQNILTNQEVIAVDQDPLGLQGIEVSDNQKGLQVWSKELVTPGQRAVVLFNRTDTTAAITVTWNKLGLQNGTASVRDLLTHKDLGMATNSYTVQNIPPQGVAMLKISGQETTEHNYSIQANTTALSGGAIIQACSACQGKAIAIQLGLHGSYDGQVQFNNIEASQTGLYVITIYYQNPGQTTKLAMITSNEETTALIRFAPTGTRSGTKIEKITVILQKGENTISIDNSGGEAPDIAAIAVPD